MIAIIDYGLGNIASVLNMFKRIGNRDVILTKDPIEIKNAAKILLPGVGAFDNGMNHLKSSGLIPLLNDKALVEKVPVLGICLGMQLLTEGSEEGNEKGLGWIKGYAKKFVFSESSDLKIPHMGWNFIQTQKETPLLAIGTKQKFYFVHSYFVTCDNQADIVATCNYGEEFTCVINHENIFGAQFHPEKSHKFGMELFENFSKL